LTLSIRAQRVQRNPNVVRKKQTKIIINSQGEDGRGDLEMKKGVKINSERHPYGNSLKEALRVSRCTLIQAKGWR